MNLNISDATLRFKTKSSTSLFLLEWSFNCVFIQYHFIRQTHVPAHLSEVKLEHVADIMWRTLRELDQLLPVLEGLTQLLHAGLHPVHPVDALQRGGCV